MAGFSPPLPNTDTVLARLSGVSRAYWLLGYLYLEVRQMRNVPDLVPLTMLLALGLLAAALAPAVAETALLASFETDAELANWEIAGDAELSAEHATEGRRSLLIHWPQGRGLITKGFPADWSAWELLKVDCFNPGPPFSLTLRTDDEGGATISSWYHYVRTGASTLEFVVKGLAERINVAKIRMAHIRVDPVRGRPLRLYFDKFRFTRDEPPEVYQPPTAEEKPIPRCEGNLLAHGDFENGLQGWDSWGEWDGGLYEFATGAGDNAHSGAASAAVICNKLGRGGIFSNPITLPATDTYTLSFWVRGSLGGRIRYGLEAPELEDTRDGQVTTEWQQIADKLSRTEGDVGRVYLHSCAPGTVYFDEVRLVRGALEQEPEAPAKRLAPQDPGNRIANPNFELGLHDWGSWGEWDDGLYEFATGDGANAYSGDYSAAIICNKKGRGGVMTKPMKLPPDQYTLRFLVKGSEPSTIRYGAIYPGGELFRDAAVETDWQTLALPITSEEEGKWRVYLMSTGEGVAYFDEVSLKGTREVVAAAEEPSAPERPSTQFEMRRGHTYVNGEAFFALGVYRAVPGDLQDTAFNCIPGWDQAEAATLDACQQAGIYLLPDLTGVMRGHLPHRVTRVAQPLMDHPAVLAWYVCDEPDHERWNVPPDEMRLATKLLHDLDPQRLTCAVVMPWAESNLYRYADTVDILMTDIYPIGDKRPADLSAIWRGTGVMRRAVNDDKPVWAVVQATAKGTPEEHVAATYLAVVEGADGILYWEYEDGRRRPEVWEQICEVARELDSLRLVLTSDDAPEQASCRRPEVRTLRKATADGHYLIAVNGTGERAEGCKISLRGTGDGKAEVLFEDRSVPLANSSLSDDFEPFARHVYRLP